jgi:hypothetical protein
MTCGTHRRNVKEKKKLMLFIGGIKLPRIMRKVTTSELFIQSNKVLYHLIQLSDTTYQTLKALFICASQLAFSVEKLKS